MTAPISYWEAISTGWEQGQPYYGFSARPAEICGWPVKAVRDKMIEALADDIVFWVVDGEPRWLPVFERNTTIPEVRR